jgi:hypothetical protein
MKHLLILLLLSFTFSQSFGQIAKYSANTSREELFKSPLRLKFQDKYNTIISFCMQSYWSDRVVYKILAFDGQNWKLLQWSYRRQYQTDTKTKKEKLSVTDLEEKKALDFINTLETNDFFLMNEDSLNLSEKQAEDDGIFVKSITDGTNNKFEVISDYGYFSISAYEPEQLQDFVQVIQRQKFLICRQRFLELFEY